MQTALDAVPVKVAYAITLPLVLLNLSVFTALVDTDITLTSPPTVAPDSIGSVGSVGVSAAKAAAGSESTIAAAKIKHANLFFISLSPFCSSTVMILKGILKYNMKTNNQ